MDTKFYGNSEMRYTSFVIALVLLLPLTHSFGQTCNYTISPSTHHDWIDVSASAYSDCVGLGCDSTIIRDTRKLHIGSEPISSNIDSFTRSFIKFDLFANTSNSCEFVSADLKLFFTGNSLDSHSTRSGANDFYISRILEPWGEDTLRWQSPPPVANYRMPATASRDRISVSGSTIGDEDFTVDITRFMNFWREYPDSNFGFEIRLVNEDGTRSLTFANSSFPNPSVYPRIDAVFANCSRNDANAGADAEICIGDTYELNGRYGEFFRWDNDPTLNDVFIANPTVSNTSVGTNTYTLTTTLGDCSSEDEVTITTLDYPSLTVSGNEEICFGESVQLSATGATNYEWTPNTFIDDNTSANPTVYPERTTVYRVAADDGNKCISYDSVRVVVRPLTPTDAGEDKTYCEGEDPLQLQATGGNSFEWIRNTNGLSSTTVADPEASPSVTTTYYVVGDNGFCPIEDSVTVTVIPTFSVDAGEDFEICVGDTAYFDAEAGFSFYRWADPTLFNNANIADPYILGLTENTDVSLYVEDENGCSATDDVSVIVHDLPELELGPDTFMCLGDEIVMDYYDIDAVEPIQYTWSPGYGIAADDMNIAAPTISGQNDTFVLYQLDVVDGNGCQSSDQIRVSTLPGLEIETIGDTTICNGVATQVRVKGGRFFRWYGDGIIGSDKKRSATVKPNIPTTYRVEVTTGEECADAVGFVTVNVVALPRVEAHLENDPSMDYEIKGCKGRNVIIEANGAEQYIWSTEDSTQKISHRVLIDSFPITVFGISKGCRGPLDTVLVRIDTADTCFSQIFAPSAFTPNDDGTNDSFNVVGFLIRSYKIVIFNRWGQRLYESTNIRRAWNGYHNGQRVPEGAYFYTIEAFGEDEESRNTSGTVQVIY